MSPTVRRIGQVTDRRRLPQHASCVPPPDTTEGTVGGAQLDRETDRWVHPIVYLPLYPGLGL